MFKSRAQSSNPSIEGTNSSAEAAKNSDRPRSIFKIAARTRSISHDPAAAKHTNDAAPQSKDETAAHSEFLADGKQSEKPTETKRKGIFGRRNTKKGNTKASDAESVAEASVPEVVVSPISEDLVAQLSKAEHMLEDRENDILKHNLIVEALEQALKAAEIEIAALKSTASASNHEEQTRSPTVKQENAKLKLKCFSMENELQQLTSEVVQMQAFKITAEKLEATVREEAAKNAKLTLSVSLLEADALKLRNSSDDSSKLAKGMQLEVVNLEQALSEQTNANTSKQKAIENLELKIQEQANEIKIFTVKAAENVSPTSNPFELLLKESQTQLQEQTKMLNTCRGEVNDLKLMLELKSKENAALQEEGKINQRAFEINCIKFENVQAAYNQTAVASKYVEAELLSTKALLTNATVDLKQRTNDLAASNENLKICKHRLHEKDTELELLQEQLQENLREASDLKQSLQTREIELLKGSSELSKELPGKIAALEKVMNKKSDEIELLNAHTLELKKQCDTIESEKKDSLFSRMGRKSSTAKEQPLVQTAATTKDSFDERQVLRQNVESLTEKLSKSIQENVRLQSILNEHQTVATLAEQGKPMGQAIMHAKELEMKLKEGQVQIVYPSNEILELRKEIAGLGQAAIITSQNREPGNNIASQLSIINSPLSIGWSLSDIMVDLWFGLVKVDKSPLVVEKSAYHYIKVSAALSFLSFLCM